LSRALSLVAAKEQININLDLKSFSNLPKIQTLVEEADMLGRVFFTGVTLEYTAQVKRECPKIPYYLNISSGDTLETQEAVLKLADDIKGCAAVGVNLSYKQASAQLSKIMQENGLKLSVWTVNKRIDMYKMLAIEPNNITTKRPIVLLKIIEEQNND
ncbi:MAG: glycerophosphodiester phosphodiesterase, partial [Prolixibacteraceae bacterium]|nr:glycerophosphodiester phosphodiesterase [Prolixibacteraceae bacterium]